MATQVLLRNSLSLELTIPTFEDIPQLATYSARRDRLSATATRDSSLPVGFDKVYHHPSAWSGQTIDPNTFIHHLSEDDIAEIQRALKCCKQSISTLDDVSAETFQLPSLGPRLRELGEDIYLGRGLVLLRGLRPERFCRYDNVVIYKGVTSYIAPDVGVQGPEKDSLIHVQPYCSRSGSNADRPRSNALPFHQDFCEILSLFVINPAVDGGDTLLASATQVYNELASNRPEVIRVLSESAWPFRRNGVQDKIMRRPVLYPGESRPLILFSRRNLTGCYQQDRSPDCPRITDLQIDALDALHFAAEKHALKVSQQEGDITILNNLAVLHGREDFPENPHGHDRHLLRLWLRDSRRATSIPKQVKHIWDIVYGEASVAKRKWDLQGHHSHSVILNESDASTVG